MEWNTVPGADPTDTVIGPVTEEQGQYNREESIGKQLDIHVQKSKKESGRDPRKKESWTTCKM